MMTPNAKSSSISAPVLAASFAYMLSAVILVLLLDQGVFQGGGLRVLTVLVPVITLCVLRMVHSTWLNLVSVFVALTSLFSFGQVWQDLSGLPAADVAGYAEVVDMFPSAVLDRALALTLTMICMVAIGSIMATFVLPTPCPQRPDPSPYPVHPSRLPWVLVALALFVPVLVGDVRRAVNVSALGYGAGYKFESPLLYLANAAFPIVIIGLLLTWRGHRGVAGLVLVTALVRNFYVIIAVQNRGQAVVESIVYLLIWEMYYGFSTRQKWLTLIGGAGALGLLPYVSYARSGLGREGFLVFLAQHNALSIFLTEFGGTLASVAYAVQYVDAGGQTMGASYLVSLVGTAIPGLGSVLIDAAGQPLTGEALNSYFGRTGLGGSFVADLYLNLGSVPLALVVSIAFGFSLKILALALSYLTEQRMYRLIWCWFIYFGTLVVVRGYMTDLATAVKVGGVVILLMWIITQSAGSRTLPTRRGMHRTDAHFRPRQTVPSHAEQFKDEE